MGRSECVGWKRRGESTFDVEVGQQLLLFLGSELALGVHGLHAGAEDGAEGRVEDVEGDQRARQDAGHVGVSRHVRGISRFGKWLLGEKSYDLAIAEAV